MTEKKLKHVVHYVNYDTERSPYSDTATKAQEIGRAHV